MILQQENDIYLDKLLHEYRLNSDEAFSFTSVTTLIGSHFEEFNPELVATNLVENNIKYAGRTVEELVEDGSRQYLWGIRP